MADSGPREHMRCGHVMRDVTLADLGGHDGRRKVVFNVKENINCQSAFMSTSLCVFLFNICFIYIHSRLRLLNNRWKKNQNCAFQVK